MLANLQDIDEKLHMLERQLSDPELVGDQQRYREVVREHSLVAKLAELHAAYSVTCAQIRGNQELVHSEGEDPELVELARGEIAELKEKKERIEGEIREKEQARKEYEAAKAAGQRTGLVEQQRANLFTTSLANLAPGAMFSLGCRIEGRDRLEARLVAQDVEVGRDRPDHPLQ